MHRYSLGLEFGDESVFAVVADIRDGVFAGRAREPVARQQPGEWLEAASRVCRIAMREAGATSDGIVGVGVACTSGTFTTVSRLFSARSVEISGLPRAIPITPPVPDTHAAVLGAGVAAPSTLVMLIEPRRSVHLLNSRVEATVPGVVGPVPDGILPGYFGYEFLQGPMNDVAAHAFELRSMCDALRAAGVPVRRFVAVGQLTIESPHMLQTYADVLDARIKIPQSDQPVALGAAIFGCLAAGPERLGFASMSQVIHAMARQRDEPVYRPDLRARKDYERLYAHSRAHLPIPSRHQKP